MPKVTVKIEEAEESSTIKTMSDIPLEHLLNDQEMVSVVVGRPDGDQETFFIHKKLLMIKSSYFETRNSTDHPLDRLVLPPDSFTIPAFRLFAKWVYRDTVDAVETPSDSKTDLHLDRFYELYFSAGKLCKDSILQDLLMDRIRDFYRSTGGVPSPTSLKRFYKRAVVKSPLRRFFTESIAWAINMKKVNAMDYSQPIQAGGDFAMDLILLFQKGSSTQSPLDKANCDFHWHKQGRSCDGSET